MQVSDNQWGFCSGESKTGAVLSVLFDWESQLDGGHEVILVFFIWSSSGICLRSSSISYIYIDNLARIKLSDGSIVLYADDICLYRPILSSSDVQLLQQDIDKLQMAISDLGLRLNTAKCKYLLLSRKKDPSTINISISGCQLEQVSSYKCLGFMITSNLNWSSHIQGIYSRARIHLQKILQG